MQKGRVYEAGKWFYIRFYQSGRLKTEKLCEKAPQFTINAVKVKSRKERRKVYLSEALQLKRDEFMLKIRQQAPEQACRPDSTIVDFWDTVYLPFLKENKRASTVAGYEKIWAQHLKAHFGKMTFKEYRTSAGSQFLTGLAKKLGRRTLQHIRSLASGLFTHAVNLDLLESNCWHSVRILGKVRAPGKAAHYTLEQAEDIISALVDHTDCQLIVALCFFLGLRPSEAIALRWEDFDTVGFVHLRRACVYGVVGEMKTPESQASLPLISQVKLLLEAWQQKAGNPASGYLFQNRKGEPADLHNLVNRIIIPHVNGSCECVPCSKTPKPSRVTWKGLYAARRGAGTVLVDLTGNLVAAQELLRHKSLTTTANFYKKQTQNALPNGMRLLEAAAGKNGGK